MLHIQRVSKPVWIALFKIHPAPLDSTLTTRITSIQSRGRPRRERTSKGLLESSPPPESSHDKTPANSPTVKSPIAKYTKEDLQKIFKTVFKAQALPFYNVCKKTLKAKSPDIYCGNSHMECYNFCQQYEDLFTTAGAKGPNRILFAELFLHNHINFCWQQYQRKYKAENIIPIIWKEFKTFHCQSLGDSRAFVDSY